MLWLPAVLTLVVLRGVLFHDGWIEYSADFAVNIRHAAEWQNWATAWNSAFGTDNSATLSQAPPNLLFLSLFSTAIAQKLFLALTYFTMGSAMFSTSRWWLRRLRGTEVPIIWPLLASTIFTINGWVAIESIHLYYLWMYALLPLTFRFTVKSLEVEGWLARVLWSMLTGVVAIATFTAYGIAFHSILVAILAVVWVLSPPHHWAQRFRQSMCVLGAFVVAVCASGMYWLLPTVFGFHSNYANGTSWAIFNTNDMFTLSPYTPVYDTIRGTYNQVSGILTTLAVGHIGWVIGSGLMFMLVVLAGIRLFMGGRDWTILGVATAGVVFVFMANGTNAPLGSIYARIASAPGVRQLAYVLLKGPYKLVPETMFCLFLLAFATLASPQIPAGAARVLTGASAIVLVAGCLLVGGPLLTGDLDGYMTPVQPPKQYIASLDQLAQVQSREPGSTVWLPLDSSGNEPSPDWGPSRAQLPLIGGQLPPETSWLAPAPVSSRSVTWLGPASGRLYDELFTDALENVPESNLGELLTAGGRRYVAVRLDAGARATDGARLLSTGSGLTEVDANQWLDAYRASSNTVSSPSSVTVGVGGLEQLVIDSGRGSSSPSSRPIVFATDLPSSVSARQELLSDASEVSFSPSQGWNDLALDAWSGPGTVFDLANSVSETVPLTAWEKDALDSNTWIQSQLGGLQGQLFSPNISPTFLVANGPASTTEKICASNTAGEVWIRYFVSPLGGDVRASVDGNNAESLSSNAPNVGGWVWGRIATLQPASGCHTIGIHVDGSLSGLDQMIVAPAGAVTKAVIREQALLGASDVSSGGYWNELTSPLVVTRSYDQLPTTLSLISGSLDPGVDRSNRVLPVTIKGHAHPVSHFFAAKTVFSPSNFSGGQRLDLIVDTHATYPLADLTVSLTDTHGTTSTYQPILPVGSRTLSLELGSPESTVGVKGAPARPIDLSAIDQIEFETRANISPGTDLRLTLRGIDVMGEASSKTISVPRSGSYRLVVGRSDPRSENATVQGVVVPLTPSNGWEVTPPLQLQAGDVTISTSQALGAHDIVELFSGAGKNTWWKAVAPRSNTRSSGRPTGAAKTIFLTTTPFSPQWTMAGTSPSDHLQMNGFVNGYLSSRTTAGAETFGPNYWLEVGRCVSAVFVAGLLALLGLIYWRRRRSHAEDSP
jgi:hypothetical protein